MPTYYIPDHVLAEPLLRLSVCSLVRLRCVSKLWRDLIDSSYFKDMHVRRSNLERHRLVISKVGTEFYAFNSIVEAQGGCRRRKKLGLRAVAKKLRSGPDFECAGGDKYLNLSGCCNGILVFSSGTRKLVLWNPFTGSALYRHQITSPPEEFTKGWPYIQTAFGYDHLNGDYKLVEWHLTSLDVSRGPGFKLYELCVYSFKHESWTTVTDAGKLGLCSAGGYLPDESTLAKGGGAMHWLVKNNTLASPSLDALILAFDLGTHTFRKIPCAPKLYADDERYIYEVLSNLDGILCLTHHLASYSNARDIHVKIWVMMKYGMEASWTMIAYIDMLDKPDMRDNRFMKPVVVYCPSRQLMLQCGLIGNLIMYDFDTKSLRYYVAVKPGEDVSNKRCTSCVCVGSLVSPHLFFK